jgi:hypothetical protein
MCTLTKPLFPACRENSGKEPAAMDSYRALNSTSYMCNIRAIDLVVLCRNAVLSTVSSHASSAGFPFGSVVEFAVDAQGRPLLATSTLSPHTADLQADGRCSITVMAPGFKVPKD